MTTITRYDYLPADEAFLDPDRADAATPEKARAVVVPFGLEASVSYGGGTAAGPAAILAASRQLELFDEELWREPCADYGIATLRPPTIAASVPAALDQLEAIVETIVADGRFPFVLGGEHSITPGAVRPLLRRHPDLVVLQFDAHADLRDGYLGEHFSHAAAMRRVLDHPGVSLVSVGIRAISSGEVRWLEANPERVRIHWGKDRARYDIDEIVAPLRGRPVYVTFDIDGLDAAIMPATGTPTPGGLDYLLSLAILRRAAEVGRIVGADLVELAPIPGFHAYDFTAAQLAYKMLSYALSGTGIRACPPRR
jgi:agmatinase